METLLVPLVPAEESRSVLRSLLSFVLTDCFGVGGDDVGACTVEGVGGTKVAEDPAGEVGPKIG